MTKINSASSVSVVFLLTVGSILLNGCKYDVESELNPPNGCQTNNVTYSKVVLPIIQTNCYVCHSAAANNGGVTLEGYASLKKFVDNDRLLGAIKRLNGFSPMPQNAPKLPDCGINQIEAWIDNGALNN